MPFKGLLTSLEKAHLTLMQPGIGRINSYGPLYGLQHQQVLVWRNQPKQDNEKSKKTPPKTNQESSNSREEPFLK